MSPRETLQLLDLVAIAAALLGGGAAAIAAFRRGGRSIARAAVAPLAQRLRPRSQLDLDRLVLRLGHAGRRGRDDSDRFLEEKVLWHMAGVAAGAAALVAIGPGPAGVAALLAALVAGALIPERRLAARAAALRAAVSRGLPSAVDLV